VLVGPLARPNSDEVMSALMARHLVSDGFPAFVWGQHYGGTAELAPVALSLRLFGWSAVSLRLPDVVLAVVVAVLVWRLAGRVVAPRTAQLAGLLAWVFPGTAVWFGLREQLFYPLTVALGLGLVLVAYRLERLRWVDFGLAGLLAGLAFWTSPFAVYFAGPVLVVALVVLRRARPTARRLAGGAGLALVGAAVGALPWLLDNRSTGFASLHAGDAFPERGTFFGRLGYFFTDALPGMLGLRRISTIEWIGGPLGVLVYIGLLALVGVGAVLAVRAWRRTGMVAWDLVGFALGPFVFAAFGFSSHDPIFRYAFFAVPFLVVLASRPFTSVRSVTTVLAVSVLLSAIAVQQLGAITLADRAAGIGTPDLAPAIAVLDAHHVDAVFADYWIAYRVSFETEERVVGAPTSGTDRYPPYAVEVRERPRSAWIVVPGPQQDALVGALADRGISADVVPAGDVTVVLPSRPVVPEDVPDAARTGYAPG
jgi:4-amino-4-deoxy-L-arabinose transferase-like glycosyltransferase